MLYQLVPLNPLFKVISHYVTVIPINAERYHKKCIDIPHVWYEWESKRVHTPKDIILKYPNNYYWCKACQKPFFDIQKHSIKCYIDEW